jgi:DNA-binding NarL/FixJ family response regulator
MPPPAGSLSLREREVVDLLVQGLTNREIAARLHVSPRTVQSHVRAVMRKTGTTNRVQLAVSVVRGELVDNQPDLPKDQPDGA